MEHLGMGVGGSGVVRHFSSDLVRQRVGHEVTLGWLLMDTLGSGGGVWGRGLSRQWGGVSETWRKEWQSRWVQLGERGSDYGGLVLVHGSQPWLYIPVIWGPLPQMLAPD